MTRPPALALLVALLLLGGCISIRTVDDGIARARIGERVAQGGVSIVPLALLEDSRCPAGVTCIQAGTVRIAADIAGVRTELALGQPASVAGASVSLVEVYPQHRKDITYYPDEYRFGFRVTR
ncbi:hypothetical protein ACFOD9_11175 [Novosphingobium bradum]|uniref:Lipoprotein n=1 Tax=Novosphingobium bradum TaxID=1737444 RepID=A0ABV7IQ64_9SPHN